MATPSNPAEIARETLKQLLTRRMPPSPENYRAIYNEIAGLTDQAAGALAEREFKSLLQALPKETPAQQRLFRQLEQALRAGQWEDYRKTLSEFIKAQSGEEARQSWAEVLPEFLRQWETKQSGLTQARKREALDRVLASAAKNNALLFERLNNLTRSWSLNQADAQDIEVIESAAAIEAAPPARPPAEAPVPAPGPGPVTRSGELLAELRDIFVYLLDSALAPQLSEAPELAHEARALTELAYSANTLVAMQELLAATKRLVFRLEFLAEDRNELNAGLLKLLNMMVDNVSELVIEDQWLSGQIAVVRDIVDRPMNLRTINEAEQRLKEVIFKQSQLKHSLIEAQQTLKQMLAGFVDHLAEFADSTSDYHDKIELCVEKISKADDIGELEDVLSEVIRETRIIQINAQRSRDELRASKERVEEADRRINELQNELEKASTLVRHDQLTGALNRRGLDEAFESEFSRSRRRQSPLCVALLDIDNFKKLNDTLGHDVGDAALIHLVSVIRETLRPQDTVARFGGEEFVILLPDTPLENARTALIRLQRELTRRIFLNDNERVLITFSAGLTDYRKDDTTASITKRADEAMYLAKQSGKNRVVSG